jgi:hypothetical protein
MRISLGNSDEKGKFPSRSVIKMEIPLPSADFKGNSLPRGKIKRKFPSWEIGMGNGKRKTRI